MEDKMPVDDAFEFGVTPFYFLRHGETNDSRAGVLQGRRETSLNAAGRRHAEEAGLRIAAARLRSIYASPLVRAWHTASIVSLLTGAPAYRLAGLMERDWGVYQGRQKDLRPDERNPETVETVEAFSERVLAALRSIKGPPPTLVVAHSGVFRMICDHIGLRIDTAAAVASGQLVLLEPPNKLGRGWHLSEV